MDDEAQRRSGFRDRVEAGTVLGEMLREYKGVEKTLVLGLPRGGMVVAAEIARILELPLDVLSVRKLGTPGHEELAMGAISTGGAVVLDRHLIGQLHIPESELQHEISAEREELERREGLYRDDGGPISVEGKRAIVVDDGAATGLTLLSAIRALRMRKAMLIVVALPVASRSALRALEAEADIVICALTPARFYAVGEWYEDFSPTTNDEVTRLLREARERYGEEKHHH